ncbi:unnamed protein product [Fraxinus pennsylvanica]|uniref:Amino acid transporter transmembrane domain-containing protein n=1 Tax=Fraxinus pennsylvanica TaxID=56036 RepID=A0AAD2DSW1_9LAMI|nr:unnamed protein product [Fraxinus pennsylvanica]
MHSQERLEVLLEKPEAASKPNESLRNNRQDEDAGAAFVLESKGKWWHAGFHLTTAIVGPTILTLPYAFRGLGWGLGFFCLTVMGVVTFYSYYLMSLVLDHCEKAGRRHIRFRELAADVLGSGWMFYFVIFIQTAINTGISIGAILLAGECLQIMYSNLSPGGSLKLYHFIAMLGLYVPRGWCLYSCWYLRKCTSKGLFFGIFGINKGVQCIYFHIHNSCHFWEWDTTRNTSNSCSTSYREDVSGYRVFGNKSNSNILKSLMPDEGPSLAPVPVLGLAVIFVLLQLFAIGLVYSQVAYEIMEKKSADVNQGIFSKRNLIPRIILRSLYVVFCGFFAAMLPFFGDINGVVGAVGFIPLDFVLPMLLYNMTYKPSKSSIKYWINNSIIIIFTGAGLMGAFSSTRKLVLDAKEFKLFSSDVVD